MSQGGRNGSTGSSGSGVGHLTGNSGGALNPDGSGNINIVTANTTVKFVGAGSTLTEDFGITNLLLGTSGPSITSGTNNVSLGFANSSGLTSGTRNTLIGNGIAQALSTGSNNVGIGASSLGNFVSGSNNVFIGENNSTVLISGSRNVVIGSPSGGQYSGAESSNILITNVGVAGESNVTRIGTQGTGSGQQSQTYLAGVLNTTSGRVVNVTIPGAYPYTTLITDDAIFVDTSAARTIIPLASPVTGTTYRIKDRVGSAAANNITITPSGKNIDGAASTIINIAYGSVDICYNGTEWSIL